MGLISKGALIISGIRKNVPCPGLTLRQSCYFIVISRRNNTGVPALLPKPIIFTDVLAGYKNHENLAKNCSLCCFTGAWPIGTVPNALATHKSVAGDKAAGNKPLISTIAFGSCNRQDKEQPLWEKILVNKPQLWIWLGDNIYGDSEDMAVLKAKYELQKNNTGYRQLTAATPVIGIWDDHDYGVNDGGKEYPKKKESQQLMLDFLGEPVNSPRRRQEGGYTSYTYGSEGKQVKVILLDARYFRDPLKKDASGKANVPDEKGKILGEAQWQWLESALRESTATVHLIGSGIQILPEEHVFEKWANFPSERERLLTLIARYQTKGVILLSGDRHHAEIMQYTREGGRFTLHEVTASGLTHASTGPATEPNTYRVGNLIKALNFGLIHIDWDKKPLQVQLEIRGVHNEVLQSHTVTY